MVLLGAILGCLAGGGEAVDEGGAQEVQWMDGMWAGLAMTVDAGIQESIALAEEDRDGAAELLQAVYAGSFEPELEPAVRLHLGAVRTMEVEWAFEIAREKLGRRRSDEAIQELRQALANVAAELDMLQAPIPR